MIKNRYQFLQSVLKHIETYEQSKDDDENLDMADFAQWLFIQTQTGTQHPNLERRQEAGLGELVSVMYRYAKMYSKKAMENTPLSSVDDFGYLINLWVYGEMTKTELIARNIHEKPTGMEIIKRLIKQGFLKQTDDPQDGRSQLVAITPTGSQILFPLLKRMEQVETIAKGNLNKQEISTLLHLLRKLHFFHNNIYNTEKSLDLDVIHEKYINK